MKPREANIEVRGEQGAQDGTPSVHVRFKMYSMQTYLATLGIDYDALTKDEFISLIGILKKSKHMESPISQRGKTTMTHGKGKRKKR